MKKSLRNLIIILALTLVVMVYLFGGMSTPNTEIVYKIDCSQAENGLVHVSMNLKPAAKPFLILWQRDIKMQGINRVENLTITRAGKPLISWQTLPFYADMQSIFIGFNRQAINIEYDVNPNWLKGDSYRSYLDGNFGYLRGMVILYTPLTPKSISGMLQRIDVLDDGSGQAAISFILPENWILISPWGDDAANIPIAHLRNTYFGIGEFSREIIEMDRSAMMIGVDQKLGNLETDQMLEDIPLLYRTMVKITGLEPEMVAPYWALTVLPEEPIHGGSAGTSSLTTCDALNVISHEMFHWWNSNTIETTPDANWIQEGFTKYYEGKALFAAGIWSEAEFAEHIEKIYYDSDIPFRTADGTWSPYNLEEASRRIVKNSTRDDYYRVYNGGAMIAYHLDILLHQQEKSLDEIWPQLYQLDQPVTTDLFLNELEKLGGTDLKNTCEDWVLGNAAILPH